MRDWFWLLTYCRDGRARILLLQVELKRRAFIQAVTSYNVQDVTKHIGARTPSSCTSSTLDTLMWSALFVIRSTCVLMSWRDTFDPSMLGKFSCAPCAANHSIEKMSSKLISWKLMEWSCANFVNQGLQTEHIWRIMLKNITCTPHIISIC